MSNSIGQMTTSEAEDVTDITYYATGLTKKVSFGSSRSAEYWYDDRGQKIKTKFYNASSSKSKFTWYVSDAGGNPLAIYEYDEAVAGTPVFVLTSQPLYGSGRIGMLDKTTDIIDYEITDHLGNVRATIKATGSTGEYQLTTRADYYAFGGAQPGRTYNLNTYRYNYQGQESAVNSSWQAFDLRMHNSDLGRWFAPDPYGQFASPYISMGNNPVSGVDPDGGYVSHPGVHGEYWGHTSRGGYTDPSYHTDYELEMMANKQAFYDQTHQGEKYRSALKELEKKYGGASGLYNDAGYVELFNLMAKYGINASAPSVSHSDMSNFAHGGSIAVLENNGQNTSHSYEAQESDKIQTLAALGGYKGKDGRTYETNGNGEMGVLMGEYLALGDGKGGIDRSTAKLIGTHWKSLGGGNAGQGAFVNSEEHQGNLIGQSLREVEILGANVNGVSANYVRANSQVGTYSGFCKDARTIDYRDGRRMEQQLKEGTHQPQIGLVIFRYNSYSENNSQKFWNYGVMHWDANWGGNPQNSDGFHNNLIWNDNSDLVIPQ